ncbi:MAG: hypothetical protein ACLPUO_16215 [Streptosporangiaceae bacterium]|jgi:hypothetical protein
MGLHGADPAGRRRYVGAGMFVALVLVLLMVGVLAVHMLASG